MANRNTFGSRGKRIAAAAIGIVGALVAGNAVAQTTGGELIVSQNSNPPSLDAMTTTSENSHNIDMNIFEALFVYDENVRPIPMLAEGVQISDDGLSYVFTLRSGVLFHNGKEMTSEDVVASINRYARVGGAKSLMAPVASVEATGKYEVTLTLSEPTPPFLEAFASPLAPIVIIPAEEATKDADQIDIIGTGPYEFVEYVPDDHVTLKRFEGYVADTDHDGPDGFGGNKTPLVDSVTVRIIPEAGAAVAALEAGEVDLVTSIPVPSARRLQGSDSVDVYENERWAMLTLNLNFKEPPTDNPKFREAVAVALNQDEIMAIATEGHYQLNHGWQYPGTAYDAGDIGAEYYNVADVDRARALLAESGYDGEEFTILTDSNYGEHNRSAVVIAGQLQAVGINAVVKQVDWPTALQIRLQDTGWNAWTLLLGIPPYLGPYNLTAIFTGPSPRMRINDPVIDAAYQKLVSSPDLEGRVEAFAEFQAQVYTSFPVIKLGDAGKYSAARSSVKGYEPFRFPRFYDLWIEE